MTLQNALALALLGLTLVGFWWLRTQLGYNVFSAEGFSRFVDALGWGGPLVYIGMVAVAVVVSQIPGVPLTIAAGALWGPLAAGVYSVIGGFLGSMIAYYLSRTLGRSVMKTFVGKVIVFDEAKGEAYIGLVIFISRLLPLFPFDVISYAAGLSGLSVSVYALATFVGMIPSTFMLTYLGSAFIMSPAVALGLSAVALVILVGLPLLVRRFNWFGLRSSIRLE